MDQNNHNYNKIFDEFLAKNLVRFTFDESFKDLHKHESPDFISETYGVEIVKSTTQYDSIFDKFIKKYNSKKLCEISDRKLKELGFKRESLKLEQSFYVLRNNNNDALFFHKNGDNYVLMFSSKHEMDETEQTGISVKEVNKKILKLNKNYQKKKKNILVIFIKQQIYFLLKDIDDYLESIGKDNGNIFSSQINKRYKDIFEEIYISYYDVVFRYDSNTLNFTFKKIEPDLFTRISMCTKDEIEKI